MNPSRPASALPAVPADADRDARLLRWLEARRDAFGLQLPTLRAASSDASFRRYFRVDGGPGGHWIVMDAPPALQALQPFVDVARLAQAAGLNVPQVAAFDTELGFALLSDLGEQPYLGALQAAQAAGDEARCNGLMRDAVAALVRWQTRVDAARLPVYDEAFVRRELALFVEWCVGRELGVEWNADQRGVWDAACDVLVASALDQPQVAMHRDYMPRNLMVATPNPGLLDFQDAVRGPASYDIASLIRDAFISWDEAQELDWAVRHWEAARRAGIGLAADFGEHWRQLEWMGLQRHLKVLGIFCRLKHRDAKPAYAQELPRFFDYAHKVATRYAPLRPLARLLEPLMGATRIEVCH